MRIRLTIMAALCAGLAVNAIAQVAVNDDGAAANSNAMLDVASPAAGDGKGLLIPRVTEAQRITADSGLAGGLLDDSGDLRGGAAQGLIVYQTDATPGLFHNISDVATPEWVRITSGTPSSSDDPGTVVMRDGSGDFSAGTVTADIVAGTVDINGGAIDGTVIGATVPAAASFTQSVTMDEDGAYYLGAMKALWRGKGAASGNLMVGSGGEKINDGTGLGDKNTFVGVEAGPENTTGYYNTVVGAEAFYYNTVGGSNTAVGTMSMYYNQDGCFNSAFGEYSLMSNTGGSYSTAVGSRALYSNTTGHFNCALGMEALEANTTGQNNCAVGYESLFGNTSGYDNCTVGSSALYTNTVGFGNCAMGARALYSSKGNGNTGVGDRAGDTITTGGNNTFLGSNADATAGTYSNCMALGYSASVDASNKVVIGNSSVTTIGGYANWSNYSDRREKKNIADCDLGIDFIEKLRPVSFQYTEQEKLHNGFIAQEVEQACDELGVEFGGLNRPENPETGRYMLSYSEFVVPLVNAVKEQQKQIELLETDNHELRARIESLEKINR